MSYSEQLDLFTALSPMSVSDKIAKYGITSLTDYEIVSKLTDAFVEEKNVHAVSEDILKILRSNDAPTLDDFLSIKNMKPALAYLLVVALELGRRNNRTRKKTYSSPNEIYNVIRHFHDETQEHFIVVALNGAHELIFTKCVASGTINRTVTSPREVFADALKERAVAIVIAHNHPSGQLVPSTDDVKLTERVVKCGELLGIKVLDHLIFTDEGFYSFVEQGLLPQTT